MATQTDYVEERGISIGRIISRAFGMMGDNPLTVFGLAFLLGALPQLLFSLSGLSLRALAVRTTPDDFAVGSYVAVGVAGGLLYLLLAMLLQGALVRATAAFAEGRRASFGECLGTGLRAALPLLAVAILFALGVGFGFMLLIVPGILLYIRWAVVAPTLVEERNGVLGAFRRSAALTKGAGWRIFGLMLVILVVLWLVSAVAGAAMLTSFTPEAVAQASVSPLLLVINTVLGTFMSALTAAVPTSLYVELRRWKEGPGTTHLAEIFA